MVFPWLSFILDVVSALFAAQCGSRGICPRGAGNWARHRSSFLLAGQDVLWLIFGAVNLPCLECLLFQAGLRSFRRFYLKVSIVFQYPSIYINRDCHLILYQGDVFSLKIQTANYKVHDISVTVFKTNSRKACAVLGKNADGYAWTVPRPKSSSDFGFKLGSKMQPKSI